MKFNQLQIGQRFRHQGKIFTKTGPIQATPVGGKNQQMMMRSLVVETVDREAPMESASTTVSIDRNVLVEGIEKYHRACLETLDSLEISRAQSVDRQLTRLKQELLELLD